MKRLYTYTLLLIIILTEKQIFYRVVKLSIDNIEINFSMLVLILFLNIIFLIKFTLSINDKYPSLFQLLVTIVSTGIIVFGNDITMALYYSPMLLEAFLYMRYTSLAVLGIENTSISSVILAASQADIDRVRVEKDAASDKSVNISNSIKSLFKGSKDIDTFDYNNLSVEQKLKLEGLISKLIKSEKSRDLAIKELASWHATGRSTNWEPKNFLIRLTAKIQNDIDKNN